MIGIWFILSYPFGASNMKLKHDMINVSYSVSLIIRQTLKVIVVEHSYILINVKLKNIIFLHNY